MRMRDGNPLVDQVLARQGRYQDVRDNLRIKEIRLPEAGEARFILCHNPGQATRDQARRDADLGRIEAELAALPSSATVTATDSSPRRPAKRTADAHLRAECTLRAPHPRPLAAPDPVGSTTPVRALTCTFACRAGPASGRLA
jgi:hypothetical protein